LPRTLSALPPVSPFWAARYASFVAASADPRSLRSFPTRRSSDLAGPALRHRLGHFAVKTGVQGGARRLRAGAAPLPPAHPEEHRDRKSTRLNSSHVSISYAVFCLKKKKLSDVRSGERRL